MCPECEGPLTFENEPVTLPLPRGFRMYCEKCSIEFIKDVEPRYSPGQTIKHEHLVIPEHWTFDSKNVAKHFSSHVREQLPWYDLATDAVAHIARHYISPGSRVYDIGASRGNICLALADTLKARATMFIAIEKSEEMVKEYGGLVGHHGECQFGVHCGDATQFDYMQFDFCTLFLSLMFMPIGQRASLIQELIRKTGPGGAIVIVDKVNTPPGYAGSVLRRLTFDWKLKNGASAEDIVKKELSLAGYQRPINPEIFGCVATEFFRFGEFAGWIIEREEQ